MSKHDTIESTLAEMQAQLVRISKTARETDEMVQAVGNAIRGSHVEDSERRQDEMRAKIVAKIATAMCERVVEVRRTLGDDAAQAVSEVVEDLLLGDL